MKAIQIRSTNLLELVEQEIPQIAPDELLIQTRAATICTSDLNDVHFNPFGIELPVILGHEGAGVVAQVGREVVGFQPGDPVATHPVHPCGNCSTCRQGFPHLCLNMGHFGFNLPGTFAEYYVVRQDRCRRLAKSVDFATAALVEPVCVCLEALAQARLAPGANLLVIGDGPFGILMTRLASRFEPAKVVIAGYFDTRLAFARGALTLNTRTQVNAVEGMLAPLDGDRYDAVILAVGSSQAFQQGLQCLRPRGRLVVFSAIHEPAPIDLFQVHLKELEIIGACSDLNRLDEAVVILQDEPDLLVDMITHRFRLEEYEKAFAQADQGKETAMKVAFVFDAP